MKSPNEMRLLACVGCSEPVYEPRTSDSEIEIGTLDLLALEGALRIKDETGCTVVALTVGPDSASKAIRTCYNKGCDSGIHIRVPPQLNLDAFSTAKLIASAVEKARFDLILLGDIGTGGSGLVPIYLSQILKLLL